MLEIVASRHKFTTDSVCSRHHSVVRPLWLAESSGFFVNKKNPTTKLVYVDPQCAPRGLGIWYFEGWTDECLLTVWCFITQKVSQCHPKFSFKFGFLGGKGFDGFRCAPPSSFLTFSVKIWAGLASQKATFSLTIGQNQDVATADVTLVRHDASGWTTSIQNNPRRNDLNWWQKWDDSNRWQELGV